MQTRFAALGSALFFLVGPGFEAGLGPWLLTRLQDGGRLTDATAVKVAGAVLLAAGAAVLLTAFVRFVRDGVGTPSPAAPTGRLVATGAYRVVRHPMYLATAAAIAGEALLFGRVILLAAAFFYLATMAVLVSVVEEPRLRARFGAEYDAYARAVPAWVPGLGTASARRDRAAP